MTGIKCGKRPPLRKPGRNAAHPAVDSCETGGYVALTHYPTSPMSKKAARNPCLAHDVPPRWPSIVMPRAAWSRQSHRDPVCAGRPEEGAGPDQKASKSSGSFSTTFATIAAAAAAHCCSATDAAIIRLCLSDCLAFALSCLVLHCLALTPPLSSSIASGRRHASGPLWLPSALSSARVAAEKGGEG